MASSSQSSDDEMIASINITPLVDVVLVLLIILMITAPMIYQSAIQVQLPKAKSGEQSAGQKNPLEFTLTKEGAVAWGKEMVSWEALTERLKGLGQRAADETAVISADTATPHGTVIRLMDALRTVGLTKFSLNVAESR